MCVVPWESFTERVPAITTLCALLDSAAPPHKSTREASADWRPRRTHNSPSLAVRLSPGLPPPRLLLPGSSVPHDLAPSLG